MNTDIYINEESIEIIEKDLIQENDRYFTYKCRISGSGKLIENIIKDTNKQSYKKIKIESINKSSQNTLIKIKQESYDDYKKLKVEDSDKIWVYNILDHKAESNRIIFEDEYVILIPDYKWNDSIDNLHILCFFKDKRLYSIRELVSDHINILENIIINCTKCIKEKYNVLEENMLMYFHYHPSVWQLHIHFTNIKLMNHSLLIPRAHCVRQVIENLKIDSDYYKKVKLEVLT
jgi:m7GpppX diphosphatase